MEDDQWHDPLLITDVSWQKELNSHSHYPSITSPSSQTSIMEDPDDIHLNANNDVSWQNRSLEVDNSEKFGDRTPNSALDGRSMLGFSLTSPDLVICAGSPDIPRSSYEVSPRFLNSAAIELSLENGINGPKLECKQELPTDEEFLDASWELLPVPLIEDKVSQKSIPVVNINSGSLDGVTALCGTDFVKDSCFTGGDIIRTATKVGDGEAISLYQTARFGNFSYRFKTLERGIYIVDLHLAEIVFTDGHPGMRVFNVYIQEQKAVSCIDIYARVGANKPLVIPDLKTFVSGGEGLSIRFEGVTGNPLVCGISVRKDVSASFGEVELLKAIEMSRIPECEISKDCGNCEVEGEIQNLQEEYERQRKELTNTRRALEELKRENECKSRECQEAWKSLKDLQNELMRKSMHVGSLAFAIEGQVKEKGKWFSSLRDLKRKLKLLKMDQIKLSEEALSYKKCLGDMNDMSSVIQSKLNQQVELHEDLKLKFIKGAKERKEFYNKILELKGNIRVFCRCRPLNTEEIAEGTSMAIDFEAARDGELTVKSNGAPKKTFKFDAVFGPQSNQVDVFDDTAPFASSVLDGYNVCIFAYGQTGTGKTFTMEGTNEARGVNFRTLEELFHIIEERRGQFQYEISVSVLEVYNEQIRDLLVSGTQPGAAKRLEIRHVGEGIHHVPGLAEAHVNNMNEAWEVLQTGSNARAVGSTNANEHSSRSHCIHCVMVKGENLLNGECTRSKLWLVDLAGSERVAKTEVQGERLKETQNINRSLSALGDVISALATKSPHIPFRNSKLTHLLQDSLGGDSKTLMFVQISPNENDLSETLCSLNFASRVRGIELGPAKKQVDSTELLKYKQLVEKTKLELKSKDVQIKKLEDTVHGLDWKMKEKDSKNKNLQDKIKELESQLLIERRLARQHVDSKLAEQQQQQQLMRQQQQEEQNSALSRPPLSSRPLQKNFNEGKEQVVLNHTRPFSELNSYKLPSPDGIVKHNDPTEKENNPEMAEQPLLPAKRTGRVSLCPILQRIPAAPAPRRNSLIPLPSAPGLAKFPQPLLPLPPIEDDKKEERDGFEDKGFLEPTPWDSPKEHKSGGGKNIKVSSILRRSLQRRVQIRSPMQQHMRRGGINVGMEKVRVSIGSRGRVAHRVLLGNARRAMKDGQQKESQREKERGWNIRTAGRII
ncbi:Kinesin-like protein [Actinidia chinensis var. chinensis]|uniref:Kinesin-like protein n=1 Tax=Actinidia chinensis var. chinensis TaxID=1590841 RepID=A0A2R6QWC5_ACTCC|nr:Kinesin-like protein [Actinidia chinensis var. chinensis]